MEAANNNNNDNNHPTDRIPIEMVQYTVYRSA